MTTISAELRRFILTSIPSIPYLEALLQLHAAPGLEWDGASLARQIYVSTARSVELLNSLAAAGLVAPVEGRSETFVYSPASPQLRALIDSLETAYARNLVEITNLIHDATQRNATRFAEAFKFRKDR